MKKGLLSLQNNYVRFIDIFICLPFLIVPLFLELPYRVNIFLSWEGAYRLYLGQVPFKDFGLPLGFGYWLLPALFFKLFGPSFLSLVKAQFFINLISLLSLRGILYQLKVKPLVVSLSLLAFCLTYIIFNFWPWYNHSVIVYEFVAFYFLVTYLANPHRRFSVAFILLGGLFTFLSFYTKQDGGAVCFAIGLALFAHHFIVTKRWMPIVVYAGSFVLIAGVFIVPFLKYDFLYWFNFGQPPHNSRLSVLSLIDATFNGEAIWEKIYLALFILLALSMGWERLKLLAADSNVVILTLISLGLIGQALVTRISSPLPTDHMTFFHGFAIALFIHLSPINQAMNQFKNMAVAAVVVTLLFSAGYWKYLQGMVGTSTASEKTSAFPPPRAGRWVSSPLKSFEGVTMPTETVDGLSKIMQLNAIKKENLKVLNMSELTPLALELGFVPPVNQPLWYHLNVGIFDKEVDELCERVKNREYDMVLFQDIPGLIHFFPFRVQAALKESYYLHDSFLAPRKLENSVVEVYLREKE